MKFNPVNSCYMNGTVAPLVGAWIEISEEGDGDESEKVAPLVGAWIEISSTWASSPRACVAPLVGAWIEISCMMLLVPL